MSSLRIPDRETLADWGGRLCIAARLLIAAGLLTYALSSANGALSLWIRYAWHLDRVRAAGPERYHSADRVGEEAGLGVVMALEAIGLVAAAGLVAGPKRVRVWIRPIFAVSGVLLLLYCLIDCSLVHRWICSFIPSNDRLREEELHRPVGSR